jgi:hypothetical protein
MAFTQQELDSIANSAINYHLNKGEVFKQTVQNKPLLALFERKKKTFPGGKGAITLNVKGDYGFPINRSTGADVTVPSGGSETVKGYTHDDTVQFYTPANVIQASYTWREHHLGITLTHTELKMDGISVTDTNGEGTRSHSRREMTMLANLLEEKLDDMAEKYAIDMNALLWGDGGGDAKALAGIRSIITDNPTTGTVGGIDRAAGSGTYAWWRNRYLLSIASSPNNGGVLIQNLQKEYLQLKRYGGNPDTFLVGSDFLDALTTEMRANGYYSGSGFASGGELSVGQLKLFGVPIQYDPTLDGLSKSKYGYWFDSNAIFLMTMENEWRRQHTPARPASQFVLYRSITSTGQLVANRCNSSGVYSIA